MSRRFTKKKTLSWLLSLLGLAAFSSSLTVFTISAFTEEERLDPELNHPGSRREILKYNVPAAAVSLHEEKEVPKEVEDGMFLLVSRAHRGLRARDYVSSMAC